MTTTFTLVALALACGGGSDPGSDSGASDTAAIDLGLVATEDFSIPEKPWDLAAWTDGTLIVSAQFGNKLYTWDPATSDRTELTDDAYGVLALAMGSDGELYLSTSDNGVTGSLSVLEGREGTPLFSQADDGTLLRDPVDLAATPDGGWVLADRGAGLLFVASAIDGGAVTTIEVPGLTPESLAFDGTTLYVGGEEGVASLTWPDGTPGMQDTRSAYGLVSVDGQGMWAANDTDKVFVVGGGGVGFNEAARPGSLLIADGRAYAADHVGGSIWSAALP
jgi:hypothetical protein